MSVTKTTRKARMVVLSDKEYAQARAYAKAEGKTFSNWARTKLGFVSVASGPPISNQSPEASKHREYNRAYRAGNEKKSAVK
jgi:uncharacterized membrane protein YidH (DUF202 family)